MPETRFSSLFIQMILRSMFIFLVLLFSAGSIHAAPKFLKPLLDFEVEESVSAIAFTADEALVVVALEKDDGSLLELREVKIKLVGITIKNI